MEKIRILQIVPNMQSGGLETFIMNIYRNIDRDIVQFDFLVHYKEKKFYDDEIEKMGGKIYRFSLRNDNNIFKYMKELDSFFGEHKEYKVIHCHMSSIGFLIFLIAKKHGIKIRIAHSHNANTEKTFKGIVKNILIKPLKYISTINYACSEKAGKFLYGNKNFEVIPNAIDIRKFSYNEEIRKKIRKQLNLENNFVIGHIGRFCVQKNHEFLIEIFNNLCRKNSQLKLILVGEGELEKKIKNKVEQLGIQDKVVFLGIVKNANEIYQAMDCFVLPSVFEGLPVSGIEAQISGLPCVFSDNITTEVKISKNVFFAPINDIKIWENYLYKIINNDVFQREKDECNSQKFNVIKIAKKLQDQYIRYYREF